MHRIALILGLDLSGFLLFNYVQYQGWSLFCRQCRRPGPAPGASLAPVPQIAIAPMTSIYRPEG
jgi:hypothetical protein